MRNLAMIPARGGSKRIPGKNIKNFLGKPIIVYSIEAALKSGIFDEVMVSTDDEKIAEIAEKYGAKVPFIRSSENANDYAGLADVAKEVITEYKKRGKFFDNVCMILSTAPLIRVENIIKSEKIIKEENYENVFTVTEYSFPIQRSLKIENNLLKMNWPENMTKRSQDLEKMYHDAGQFYFFKSEELFKQNKLFMKKSFPVILSNLEVQDIDTETDWKLAELKYKILTEI